MFLRKGETRTKAMNNYTPASHAEQGRVDPKSRICLDVLKDPTIVVGGGICGAACALALADLNIKSVVIDQRSRHELVQGMGINLQKEAIHALNQLGISTESLLQVGVAIQKQSYYCPDGRHIVSLDKTNKTRGDENTPGQIAIHRGKLLQILLDKIDVNANIELLYQHKFLNIQSRGPEKVAIIAQEKQSSSSILLYGSVVLGTDGINSNVRGMLFPRCKSKNDFLTFHGITHYRGVAKKFPVFLDGKTMILCGGLNAKMVIYPIEAATKNGKQDVNWIACIREGRVSGKSTSTSNRNHVLEFLSSHGLHLDFLNLPSLVKSTSQITAWPMVDLEPLDRWTEGRIALAGDAAHAMLPVGSGGAMAALLDAIALRDSFLKSGPVRAPHVLRLFQSIRYESASFQQKKCRMQPAETIVEEILCQISKSSEVPLEYAERIRCEMKKLHNPSKTMQKEIEKNVLIVGAGASGLATGKEFQEYGYHPVIFESGSTFGGVFRDAYENLELTSSSAFTAFSDYPPNLDETPKMWSGPEYLSYLHSYAVHNKIFENIQFNSKVIGIRRKNTEQGSVADCGIDKLWEVSVFDSVANKEKVFEGCILVICTGSNAIPSKPLFLGQQSFSGNIIHTSEVGTYEMFNGKRVLSLGIGESGSDVPYWIAKQPEVTLTIAARGLGWCVPRRRPLKTGLPTDLNTNRILWGLPRFWNRVLSKLLAFFDSRTDSDPVIQRMGKLNLTHPAGVYKTYGTKSVNFLVAVEELGAKFVQSGIKSIGPGYRVDFYDGTTQEFDIILLNTGYQKSKFEEFCSYSVPTEEDKILYKILAEASNVRNLYKRVMHPAMNDLYFVGFARPGFGSIPTIAETQARWIVSLVSGRSYKQLPSEDGMITAIATDKALEEKQFGGAASRVTTLVDYVRYVNDISSLMGSTPPYLNLLFSNPSLLFRLFVGPATVAHFRLSGPDAKPKIARETIESYPLPLKRRLHYISSLLYLVSIIILLLSFGLPLTSRARKKLQPVGFPPLRNKLLLWCRFLLKYCHLFGLASFYASIAGKASFGFVIVSIIFILDARDYLDTKHNETKVRNDLTRRIDASKLNSCDTSNARKIHQNVTTCSKPTRSILAMPIVFTIIAVLIGQFDTFFVSAFESNGAYIKKTTRARLNYIDNTQTKVGENLNEHFKKITDITPIERVALATKGNLQETLSAYHNKDVNLSIIVHSLMKDSNTDHSGALAVYEREVDIQLDEKTVIKARSTVKVFSPAALELLSDPIGIGQLFAAMNLRPSFTLHDVGRHDHGGVWRQYTLSVDRVISCDIYESFSKNIWVIGNEKNDD